MFDIWQEIFSTIRKNKLRTFLTGFSMAWGIFILIILLGAGNGLKNGVMQNFGHSAKNAVFMWPGQTSIPYKGLQKGRVVKLDDTDEVYLKREFPSIYGYSASLYVWGTQISYGKEYSKNTLGGVVPAHVEMEDVRVKPEEGRFINEYDVLQARKVIVLHRKTVASLFRDEPPLGKYVVVDKIAYQVIGIYEDENMEQLPTIYIPQTTARRIYNPSRGYDRVSFLLADHNTEAKHDAFEANLRAKMGAKHFFHAHDIKALWVWNKLRNYIQTLGIFNGITLFVWIIGIGTLIAGVVGVSNIMLITVKERTKEFGIRKALGASPFSILKLIVLEALMITAFFGYIGMVAGIGVTELANKILSENVGEMSSFVNPTVELSVVFTATFVLIISGVLAGYFPAKKAVKIKPIEALRYE
ncbi:ABC transporter permease [Odoribacter sp. OttesenSCG-928-A06]|nr:ABC transporter permease [Odoribacter sp. OttesenSCG-928-A06]